MSNWKKVSLADITESINTGLDAIRRAPIVEKETDIRCLRIQDISQNKSFENWGFTEVKDTDYKKFQLKADDIIMARTCSTGICFIAKNDLPAVFNNGLARIRLKTERAFPMYLYYVFKSKHFQDYIDGISGGTSVQLNMKIGDLSKYEFYLPELETQKKISEHLYILDKKIQLNTQINQTLEQIAQTIFKSWFIDFDPVHAKANALANGATAEQATLAAMQTISGKTAPQLTAYQTQHPESHAQLYKLAQSFPSEFEEIDGVEVPKGWGITQLLDVTSMRNGYAFKSSEWTEEGLPVIKIGSVKPMLVEVEGNGFVSEENKITKSNFFLKEGDIVVGLTGYYVGEVGRMPQHKTAMLNQRVAKFLPKEINDENSYYNFVYCVSRYEKFKEYAITNAKGSAQANISTNELLNYPIIKASDEIHIAFEKYISPLLNKILANSGENEFLANSRDLLLPKLLSGEINL